MKKVIIFILVLFSSLSFYGEQYTIDEIPIVHLGDARKYVSNPDEILSNESVATIDSTLFALEKKTGIQVMVVAVSNVEGGDLFDFSLKLAEKYGVGQKKKDNGLVIILSTELREVRFQTGYGLEGDLPDAICKRIQTRYMVPYFKDNDWNTGMVKGIEAVAETLDGTMENEATDDDTEAIILAMSIFLAVFITLIVVIILVNYFKNRCPKCHSTKTKRQSSTLVERKFGVKVEDVVYVCQKCGHMFVRRETTEDQSNSSNRGNGGGGIFIGGFGPGRSSGGFGGGSFGGGSFGGGGAGSRF